MVTFKSVHLWNGKATMRFAIPETANAGDRMRVDVSVMDGSRVDPFESSFTIEVEEERAHREFGSGLPRQSQLGGIPNVTEVRQPEWKRYEFDQFSALSVRHGGDGADDVLDLYVNMDNLYLRNELVRRKSLGDNVVRQWYKFGMVVLALGMVFRKRQLHDSADEHTEDSERNGADFNAIAEACKGLAVTIIPLMAQMHKRGAP